MVGGFAELVRLKDSMGENMSQGGANTYKKLSFYCSSGCSIIFKKWVIANIK